MDEFNFKSQICTDKVQSERLITLGLKKETADCGHFYERWEHEESEDWETTILEDGWQSYWDVTDKEIPAWSLHRLMEMMPENVTSDDWLGVSFDDVSYYHGAGEGMIGWKYYKAGNIYDCIIECCEWLIEEGYFNKEYLV